MADHAPDAFVYDPFAPAVMADPLPFYARLRRDHPIYYSDKYDAFFFSRFDDIVELLDKVDNSVLTSEGTLPTPAALTARRNAGPPPPPTSDPFPMGQQFGMPVYGEIRRAHGRPLRPNAVAGLRAMVARLAEQRLDTLLPQRRFDLVRDYAGPISAAMILHLLGMPLERAEEALAIINAGTRTDPVTGGFDSAIVAAEAIAFYMPYVQARADAGADGSVPMVDGMFAYRFEGRPFTVDEIARQLVCAFIGGIETAPKIVGHGLMELAAHPAQLTEVRADLAANVPPAVEEMLRYCAPAQWFMRTVHEPITVAGQAIMPGQRAFSLIASALRDEAEFDNPDVFIWNRPIPRVLSFGHGMHFCIGVHLARMEIQVMVEAFLARAPRYTIDRVDAVRHPSSFQWGWNEVPTEIG